MLVWVVQHVVAMMCSGHLDSKYRGGGGGGGGGGGVIGFKFC